MTIPEKTILNCDNFDKNISKTIKSFRNKNEFTDITLVSEDGQKIEAHTFVLISSSEFFRNILTIDKYQHPIIFLRGINKEYLEYILDYIYLGEVSIVKNNVDIFISIAEELKLKGLKTTRQRKMFNKYESVYVDKKETMDDSEIHFVRTDFEENELHGFGHEFTTLNVTHVDDSPYDQKKTNILNEKVTLENTSTSKCDTKEDSSVYNGDKLIIDTKSTKDKQEILNENDISVRSNSPLKEVFKQNLGFQCKVCGRNYGTKASLSTHNYIHREPSSENKVNIEVNNKHCNKSRGFSCWECGKIYGTKESLSTHSYVHKEPSMKKKRNKDNDSVYNKATFSGGTTEDLNVFVISMMEKVTGGWTCTVCRKCKIGKNGKDFIKKHVKGVHAVGVEYTCDKCGKVYRSQNCLYAHKSKRHSQQQNTETNYQCGDCQMYCKSFHSLNRHRRTYHSEPSLIEYNQDIIR